jgi:hypothetical protein
VTNRAVEGPESTFTLAAARALFRAPQAEDTCWADVHQPDGTVRACGRPEAPGQRHSARVSSMRSAALRAAISTGSHTGENGGA